MTVKVLALGSGLWKRQRSDQTLGRFRICVAIRNDESTNIRTSPREDLGGATWVNKIAPKQYLPHGLVKDPRNTQTARECLGGGSKGTLLQVVVQVGYCTM